MSDNVDGMERDQIIYTPFGQFFKCPYRKFSEIPIHFHAWRAFEWQGERFDRCHKCGILRPPKPPTNV